VIEKRAGEWRDVPFYRTYAVMTLCRILYSHANGTVVSKPRAARWAIKSLEKKWHPLIRRAIASGGLDDKRPSRIPLRALRQFVRFADAALRALA
jgi:hypothetical protein